MLGLGDIVVPGVFVALLLRCAPPSSALPVYTHCGVLRGSIYFQHWSTMSQRHATCERTPVSNSATTPPSSSQ